jgi:DNA repair exonuclease SbcCD ATPase subunit
MRVMILVVAVFLIVTFPIFAPAGEQGDVSKQEQSQDEELKKHYFYQWTDSKGIKHLTDSLEKVPPKYRSKAQKTETAPAAEDGNSNRDIDNSPSYNDEEERQADLKEQWQQRIKTARQQLADLERHYHELDQKRTELLGKWGGPASGHLQEREQLDSIEQEMKQVQQDINNARNQVEVVIPDEGRKAGIPPGWLRE